MAEEILQNDSDSSDVIAEFSSSSFGKESGTEGEMSDQEENSAYGVQPYQFEPLAPQAQPNEGQREARGAEAAPDRLQMDVNDWSVYIYNFSL